MRLECTYPFDFFVPPSSPTYVHTIASQSHFTYGNASYRLRIHEILYLRVVMSRRCSYDTVARIRRYGLFDVATNSHRHKSTDKRRSHS